MFREAMRQKRLLGIISSVVLLLTIFSLIKISGLSFPGRLFWRDLIIIFAIQLILALSLNLEYGYAGVPNFGKVLAVAGGAFAVGFFPGRMAVSLLPVEVKLATGEMVLARELNYVKYSRQIVPQVNLLLKDNPAMALSLFFSALVIAGVVGAVLGYVASYPAIRLREDYLAIILLAMGEAIGIIGLNYSPIIGGTLGVAVPDPFGWAGEQRYTISLLFIFGISLLVLFYLERLVRTPLGRMLRAVRDNEDVAESLGKDVTRIRMRAIMISSILAAVAGALYAFNTQNVFAPTYSRTTWTFWPWVMVMIGGAANNMGVILGSFGFIALGRFIDYYKAELAFVPFDVVWLYFLLLGIGIILIQMYRPGGLIPEKPTSTLGSKKLQKMASSRREVSSSKTEDSTSDG